MNDPTPSLLPDAPLELLDARTIFATGQPRRRMAGGLARLPFGRLLLTFALGSMPRRNDGAVMRSWSDDGGRSWADPLPLFAAPGWDCYPMAGPRPISDRDRSRFASRLDELVSRGLREAKAEADALAARAKSGDGFE